ncbi:DUF543-domain-containing protein [Punctularia strigosozonata HHB-11173 SS5]|uniref:DUF543-domain-containing protein n=1 Tax=Punctularia strigosozonata (strain HHB-11173) TaxID=741275 RepID=UPI000441777F|nr:DUF543-domain-containing protein [Punctularia strigosozonata HHB-11173 SS5]EIN14622.1 DUF543-domain-containing protein [Punctularia strigosozonata HHB-11173 SS5]
MSSAKPTSSENAVSQKYDRCLADLVVKAGLGFSVGVVASVVFFRRRTLPIGIGLGWGLGAAYADCDRLFTPREPGARLAVLPPAPASSTVATPSVDPHGQHTV